MGAVGVTTQMVPCLDADTGAQATCEAEVTDGAGRWIAALEGLAAPDAVLNYCAALFYDRSMVTLAAHIMDGYPQYAFCPGTAMEQRLPLVIPSGEGEPDTGR